LKFLFVLKVKIIGFKIDEMKPKFVIINIYRLFYFIFKHWHGIENSWNESRCFVVYVLLRSLFFSQQWRVPACHKQTYTCTNQYHSSSVTQTTVRRRVNIVSIDMITRTIVSYHLNCLWSSRQRIEIEYVLLVLSLEF